MSELASPSNNTTFRSINENIDTAEPMICLTLWPNRSLSQDNFKIFLGIVCVLIFLPFIPLLMQANTVALLLFPLATFLLLYAAFRRNYKDGKLVEVLKVFPSEICVSRENSNGHIKYWSANPYWTKVKLYNKKGLVENYLTLTGNGREIELGAFLTPEERISIKVKIDEVLKSIQSNVAFQ
jgi:uncharacterized membrane protein